MPIENELLIVGPIPARFDRTYKARDRGSDAVYEVNLAHLECSCGEFRSRRASFPPNDARRVCDHIYDKLYATKMERSFDSIIQLFIRYGRTMYEYRVVTDDFGVLVVGRPFGPKVIRALGVVDGKPLLATYDAQAGAWSSGETDLNPILAARLLERMRSAGPEAF